MRLEKLGFSERSYSEVILSVRVGGEVNAAPMGILLRDGMPLIKVYRGGKTHRLLAGGARDCVLNVTSDPALFYRSVLDKERIVFVEAKKVSSPRVYGCDAYAECLVSKAEDRGDYLEAVLEPVLVEARRRDARAYCRAGPAVLEALVHFTKLLYFRGVDRGKAEELLGRIRIFVDIVYHTTMDRELRSMADDILDRSLEAMRGAQNLSSV